ncbi:hypothetical protein F5Y01DRAFT_315346 [Xylaria sp. FL0043]|nr:hypothetical protein F5Y01DRAFT_315346 [Xylaria sp. FL0043]
MTPLYLCASSTTAAVAAAADSSTSSMSSAPISDSTTRRPSNVIMHPPKPKKKKTHSTDPYLRDFTLVAEAARRAQMSLMMRDMENVGDRESDSIIHSINSEFGGRNKKGFLPRGFSPRLHN